MFSSTTIIAQRLLGDSSRVTPPAFRAAFAPALCALVLVLPLAAALARAQPRLVRAMVGGTVKVVGVVGIN